MASNAEILAQLESLAEAAIAGATIHVECDGLRGMAFLNALKGADFPAILAAVKRWVEIEEAARGIISNKRRYSICTDAGIPSAMAACAEYLIGAEWVNTLDAALKEPQ